LALVIPPLGEKRRRSTQWLHIAGAIGVAALAAVPYTVVIFEQEAAVLYLSRLGLAIMLPFTIGLPFLIARAARRDEGQALSEQEK
jgi:hypothetical protein